MPQNHDPNYRANPISAANLAIANLHAEREQMRALLADMRVFLTEDYPMDTATRHTLRVALMERADALLEGK